jgi:hypothetical protein
MMSSGVGDGCACRKSYQTNIREMEIHGSVILARNESSKAHRELAKAPRKLLAMSGA